MRFRPPWALLLVALQALFLFSCSRLDTTVTGPERRDASRPAPLNARPSGPMAVPDGYIVVFNDAVSDVDREVDAISQQHGIRANYRYRHAIKGFAATLPASAVEALRSNPNVDYIDQDGIVSIVDTQNNPTWGLDRIDQRNLPLSNSYTYNQTGAGVDAYILDTGIRLTHVEFGGRAVTGFDAILPGGTAADDNGHGTHVSGTVGGTTYGVAKSVRLIAVKVLNAAGSGTFAQVIAGVDWVTGDHTTNSAVANMSLSGGATQSLDDAVAASIADGVVYCVAAGNNATDASTRSPARVPTAVTVGATSITDGWASFSNYGPLVDISAPGVNVTSAWFTTDNATNTISGTSMATPHTCGVAALYLEVNPGSSPAAVSSALTSNATSGVITGIPAGTANLLLYSAFIGGPPPPPGLAAPNLVSPSNGANVSRTPTLTWSAVTGATSYRVQVSTSTGFGTLAFDQAVGGTSVTVSPALAGKTSYFWRVNASNATETSPWSAVGNFRTRKNN
jgi:subtilisin family serine protease